MLVRLVPAVVLLPMGLWGLLAPTDSVQALVRPDRCRPTSNSLLMMVLVMLVADLGSRLTTHLHDWLLEVLEHRRQAAFLVAEPSVPGLVPSS